MGKVDMILGEMDIRGKINEIDAQKKFHLIEDHWPKPDDPPHPSKDDKLSKKSLLQLFFGLEVIQCGRRGGRAAAGGIIIAADSRYNCSDEFLEYEEETSEEGTNMQDRMDICMSQVVSVVGSGSSSC
jgi:hypothetical protein